MNIQSSAGKIQHASEKIVYIIGILISLLHIYFNIFSVLPTLTQNALHYSGIAILCALIYPLSRSLYKERNPVEFLLSLCFGVAAACCAIYLKSLIKL